MEPKRTHILLVENDPGDARLIREMLESRDSERFKLTHVDRLGAALEQLDRARVDLVLLDLSLPDSQGYATFASAQANIAGVPIVVLSGLDDEAMAIKAAQAGAQDYLVKGSVDSQSLVRAIRYAIERHSLRADLEHRTHELRQMTEATTHDLQTPLASLRGAVHALREELGETNDEPVEKWLQRIEGSTKRMAAMLDDLMAYVKAGSEELECTVLGVAEVLESAFEDLLTAATLRGVQVTIEPTTASVFGDPKALHRVFSNIIGNAIKFMGRESGGVIQITAAEHDGVVRVRIVDNGRGIPTAQLSRVFLPFQRASVDGSGTGLGLSIVRRYTEALGGRVWLESDGSSGTTAVVELPATPSAVLNGPEGMAA